MLKTIVGFADGSRRAPSSGVDRDRFLYRGIAAALLICAVALSAFGQSAVLTQHNDVSRTGQNTTETILTTSNVNVNQFGKLFALPTNGQVYAQPLYVPGVTMNGATHNVLIVASEADSVYAFDADSNTGANSLPLWKASLVDAAHGAGAGETALNSATTIDCTDIQPQIGVTSTPVIDPASNTIYVEAKSTNGSSYFHRLHALDLLTGNEKSPGPIQIAATIAGTGDGSTNGQLIFNSATMSLHQLARPGLLLMNGTIFIAYASHCDFGPFHGWLFAYDEATLTQKSVYVTTPNGGLGGFWMSGAGIAADSSGNIFIASANGDFDTVNVPARETGDTLLKLGTTSQILTQLDYFTPQDQQTLSTGDVDLGSGGVLLLPDQPGSFPHILVQAGKEGRIYVVNRDQLTTGNSHYCSGCANDSEIIEESASGAVGGMWSMPAYWNNNIYFWGNSDVLKSIPVTNGLPDFTHISSNSTSIEYPGATPSISSNGTAAGTAILWAIDSSQYGSPGPSPGPAVVYAYDATNVLNQLWNSTRAANNRDQAGNAVKFTTPTISNGKVYVGTSTEVDVYGLFSGGVATAATPVISPASESVASAVQVTMTDSTPGAHLYYTTDGSAPSPTHGTLYSSAFTLTSSATVQAMAAAPNFTNSATASQIYTIQSNPASAINYASGLSATGLTLSGSAAINGSRLRLTNTGANEAGSAFFSTAVNVQSFTTDFSFQLTAANADGFTFTIHGGSTAAALGSSGGGLGFGPNSSQSTVIPTSVAVKFDLYSNAGEGPDSTGLYTNGASPTVPAVNMTSSGVNLHSGDIFQVHMSYNGTNLAMTITDISTENTFSQTFQNINIPGTVGGNTAYVGFTGGTGGLTAIQEIIGWSYVSGPVTTAQAATPAISPASESVASAVQVTMIDSTPGASIYYTTDGSAPSPTHGTLYSSAFTLTSSATVQAMAAAPNFTNSAAASQIYTIQSNPASAINYASGLSATGLTLSGSAAINGSRLRLTNTGANEAGSAFFSTAVNVQSFTTDFSFQLTAANADGFTFTIHGGSTAAALGSSGGGLGFGPNSSQSTVIPTSVAVKFDLYSNAGEGPDSTGLYTNGASPTVPAVNMTSSGVNLHSGDIFQVHMSYNGTNLAMTITDISTENTFSQTFQNINIPGTVGGNAAYVGFTGGTGGLTAIQEIIGWSYVSGPVTTAQAATPAISPVSESVPSAVQVTMTDSTPGASLYYTTDGSAPSPTHGTLYSSAFTLTSSATVQAMAAAPNFTNSATASQIYTIQSNPASAINYASGLSATGLTLSGSAAINGSRLRLTNTGANEAGSAFFSTAVNVQSFTTDFSFQLTAANADGFTFTIHGGSTAAALGSSGGGLGFGPNSSQSAVIPTSVAVKFDLYSNAGEGPDSTGLYTNGASPTVPAVNMTSSGVNLHSGDIFQVHMSYNGTNLAMTITDISTENTFSQTFQNINIPGTVGGNAAYVGFTGGTGGLTAIQEIIGWSYVSGP